MSLILIVDDEDDIRYMARVVLQLDGHKVIEASHGQAALELLGSHQPDLILTDLNMPIMDGLEFIGHVRGDPKTSGIPICLVTANPNVVADVEILAKPFDLHDLSGIVEAALRRPS